MVEDKTPPGSKQPPKSKTPCPATPGSEKAVSGMSEKGGPKGPEPTRYGDWERKGIASDF